MKKAIVLISVGVLNTIHGSFHIIQFIQSMLLVAYANEHQEEHSGIEAIMHHPIFSMIMGIVGIFTLVIGVKDYIHHRRCHSHKH
jgi:hypothetical protein